MTEDRQENLKAFERRMLKAQASTVILFLLCVVAISATYYFNFKLKRQREALERSQVLIEEQNSNLLALNSQLSSYQDSLRTLSQSLESLTTAIEAPHPARRRSRTPASADEPVSVAEKIDQIQERTKSYIEQIEATKSKSENTRYVINYTNFGATEAFNNAIQGYLKKEGYTVDMVYNLKSRPSWLALKSTVFFYNKNSSSIAGRIAGDLENITGTPFVVDGGAGLGVRKGQEEWSINIHYIGPLATSKK